RRTAASHAYARRLLRGTRTSARPRRDSLPAQIPHRRCWLGRHRLKCCPESVRSRDSFLPRNTGRCFVGGFEAARRRTFGEDAGQHVSARSYWVDLHGESGDGVCRKLELKSDSFLAPCPRTNLSLQARRLVELFECDVVEVRRRA